jgi:hypothetical protein
MKCNMHACASLGMAVRVDVERMVTTQTSSSQPPLGSQKARMPKWWNEQQVCRTYTREAHTIGARTGEKGTHVGLARQRGAHMRGAHNHGGARSKGGGARSGGTHG